MRKVPGCKLPTFKKNEDWCQEQKVRSKQPRNHMNSYSSESEKKNKREGIKKQLTSTPFGVPEIVHPEAQMQLVEKSSIKRQ